MRERTEVRPAATRSGGPLADDEASVDVMALARWGGRFGVWGGVLLILDVVGHLFVSDTYRPSTLLGLPHELWHVPGVVGIVLVVLGLIAAYVAQSAKVGRLGAIGFLLLVVGVILGAAYSTIFHAVFLPAVEQTSTGLFEELATSATAAQVVRGIVVQALGLGLGAILFGAATVRAGVFPRLGGWLLIAAALAAALIEVVEPAQLISRTLFGLAFVSLGLAVSRSAGAPRPPSSRSLRAPRL